MIVSSNILAQSGYDEWTLCHDLNKKLVCAANSEYEFFFNNLRLAGFGSVDSVVSYHETSKLLRLKNVYWPGKEDSTLKIQLTNRGPVMWNARDTLYLDTVSASDKYSSLNGTHEAWFILNHYHFIVVFNKSQPYKILLSSGHHHVTLEFAKTSDRYTWNISGNSDKTEKSFRLTYQFSEPDLILLQDDKKKSGIGFYTLKRNGVFNLIEGAYSGLNGFLIDSYYRITYKRNGSIKKIAGFRLNRCHC